MCFSKKQSLPPPVTADPELARQQAEARQANIITKGEAKDRRVADALAKMSGRYGRSSLFTGGAGGAGYAAPQARSLFQTTG